MSCLQAEGTAPGVDELKAHDPETLAEALAEKIQEVRPKSATDGCIQCKCSSSPGSTV